VKVDGLQVLARHKLRGLESIEVVALPSEAERAFEPDPVEFHVVYEDADLMVIDKPVGLVVHPAPGHWRGTLMNGLLYARPDAARLPRAGIVHRLDKDTSGLMMVARSERAFERLTLAVAARSVHRRYVAVVHGETPVRFSIDAPIGRDPRDRLRMAVVDLQRGKAACTHVARLASAGGLSLLCCDLETGRTHQIRVHLSNRGFALVGDTLYGGHPLRGCVRQALHAWRLALDHPVSGRPLAFESPLPEDLAGLLAQSGLPAPVAPDEGKR
jgi:23S rRNA pseudouridine1911/1915/1917 synthase